ncbi:hypothetical protein BJX99DRAFT_238199 [Aspergillus californicus]
MPFKVLIIGGSITGLSLAAILERYGIDYELLEKHTTLAPAIGGSIGLMPHGSRVLEQLGAFAELLPHGTGVQDMNVYGPDGKLLVCHQNLGGFMDSMFGYRIFFVARQRVLRALWGAVREKERVRLGCHVAKIECVEGGAQVEMRDGRVFTGSIVVGADGLRSVTREEMWRLAGESHGIATDKKAIKSSRTCIFGISEGLAQVKSTDTWKHVRQGRHYLNAGAPGGLTFWFVFFKTRKQADSWSTLRYSPEEMDEMAAEFATDQVRPDLTFGEMYKNATNKGMVPIEEFVLKKYFHKRLILLGDSVHKMHPITGQGGNAAIEDCAFLADRLKELLETSPDPTDAQIHDVFHELQEVRQPRTEVLTQGARGLALMESLGTPFLKLMMLYVFPTIPSEKILAGIAESVTQGDSLQYLPLPVRSGQLVPFDDEIQINTTKRSDGVSYAWIALFVFVSSLRFIPFGLEPGAPGLSNDSIFSPWINYTRASYLAVNGIWTLESYRARFAMGPLLSSVPWIVLAQHIGWEVALALYFSAWILGTRKRGFYYPWPRAIPPGGAQAVAHAFILSSCAQPILVNIHSYVPLLRVDSFTLSLLIVPLLSTVFDYALVRLYGPRWEPVFQWGSFDMTYTTRLFASGFVIPGISHAFFISRYLLPAIRASPSELLTQDALNFGVFSLLIAVWIVFTVWDLHRVNITNLSLAKTAVFAILGVALTGPGASIIATWWWRERVWENARQRQSRTCEDKTVAKARYSM